MFIVETAQYFLGSREDSHELGFSRARRVPDIKRKPRSPLVVIDEDAATNENIWDEERGVLKPDGSQMRSDWPTYLQNKKPHCAQKKRIFLLFVFQFVGQFDQKQENLISTNYLHFSR